MKRRKQPQDVPAVEPMTTTEGQAPEAASDEKPKLRRGFALIPKETLRQWASLGGKVSQQEKNAHRFTSETAREAGKRGGEAIAKDRAYMRELGRRGGNAKAQARKAAQATQTETPADVDSAAPPKKAPQSAPSSKAEA